MASNNKHCVRAKKKWFGEESNAIDITMELSEKSIIIVTESWSDNENFYSHCTKTAQ